MTLQDELRAVYRSSIDGTATPSEEVWRRLDRLRDLLSTDIFLHSERPQLVITTRTGKKPILLEKKTVIGTADTADVTLDCHFVSHEHCVVEQCDDCFRVRDLGSTNGTFVNGERVVETLLRDGDIIQVGTVTIVCLTGAPVFNDESI